MPSAARGIRVTPPPGNDRPLPSRLRTCRCERRRWDGSPMLTPRNPSAGMEVTPFSIGVSPVASSSLFGERPVPSRDGVCRSLPLTLSHAQPSRVPL